MIAILFMGLVGAAIGYYAYRAGQNQSRGGGQR
jgi:hypothetical protein